MNLIDNCKLAKDLINGLNAKERKSIEEISLKIQELQGEVMEIAKDFGCLDVCGDCGGDCCRDKDGDRDRDLDATFFASFLLLADKELKRKIFKIISTQRESRDNCVFKEETDCALPPNLKPISCSLFFCSDAKLDFDTTSYGMILTIMKKEIEEILSGSNVHESNLVSGKI